MAATDAVRRGGSVLLRALAVSGLAAAAWFVCAGVAAADEDHSDEAAKTLDMVNVALGEQQTAAAAVLAESVPAVATGPQPLAAPFGSPSFGGVELFAVDYAVVEPLPLAVMTHAEADRTQEPHPTPESSSSSSSASGGYSYSGDYLGGYSHSGTVSNTMPAPLYAAKVAEKAAARAEAVQAQAPVPVVVPVAEPARGTAVFAPTAPPSPAVSQVTPNAEVVWEVPEPSAPAPTPKQAPAPSAPTASSGSADSGGGGGHRGGVIASLTGESDLKPLAAWSAERRDDGRSPGSVPGLPSTSPD